MNPERIFPTSPPRPGEAHECWLRHPRTTRPGQERQRRNTARDRPQGDEAATPGPSGARPVVPLRQRRL